MKMVATWVIYALIAFVGYFFVNFLFKFVASEDAKVVSLILYAAAAISMLVILMPKMNFSISTRAIIIAILIGICSVTATVFAIKSINLSPNPGYISAIYSANFVLLAIVSIFVFKSSLTYTKVLGILATFAGLILLCI